ncbi:MAG: hypothetical protein ACNYVW_06865 [Methanosarcinales archaeon]
MKTSIDIAAEKAGISSSTLEKAMRIKEAAKEDLGIAQAWEDAKNGKGSVDSVYTTLKEKEKLKSEQVPKAITDYYDVDRTLEETEHGRNIIAAVYKLARERENEKKNPMSNGQTPLDEWL